MWYFNKKDTMPTHKVGESQDMSDFSGSMAVKRFFDRFFLFLFSAFFFYF